jgi:hypothetical protein
MRLLIQINNKKHDLLSSLLRHISESQLSLPVPQHFVAVIIAFDFITKQLKIIYIASIHHRYNPSHTHLSPLALPTKDLESTGAAWPVDIPVSYLDHTVANSSTNPRHYYSPTNHTGQSP